MGHICIVTQLNCSNDCKLNIKDVHVNIHKHAIGTILIINTCTKCLVVLLCNLGLQECEYCVNIWPFTSIVLCGGIYETTV